MERSYAPIGYEPEDYVPEPATASPAPATTVAAPPAAVKPGSTAVVPASTSESQDPAAAPPAAPAPAEPEAVSLPGTAPKAQQAHKLTPIGYEPAPGVDPTGSGTALTRGFIGASIDVKRNFADAFEATRALTDSNAKIDFTPNPLTGYERHVASLADIDWSDPQSI